MAPTDARPLAAGHGRDLPAVAEVHIRAREAAYPAMPPGTPPAPTRCAPGSPAGTSRRTTSGWPRPTPGWSATPASTTIWLDDLYVDPDAQGAGVGSALLDLVKAQRPERLLPVGLRDQRAGPRPSTAAHGLVDLEHTDGAGNEEKEPDLRMAWPGRDPLAFFRRPDRRGRRRARRPAQPARRPHPRRPAPQGLRRARPRPRARDRPGPGRPRPAARRGAARPDRARDHHREPGRRRDRRVTPRPPDRSRPCTPNRRTVGGACHHRRQLPS